MKVALRLRVFVAWLLLLALVPAIAGMLEAVGELDLNGGSRALLYAAGTVLAVLGLIAYCQPPSLSLSSWVGALRARLARDLPYFPEKK